MISSQKEYDNELKAFKKKLKKVRSSNELEVIMNDAVKIGLFSKEDAEDIKLKFINQMGLAKLNPIKWIKENIKSRLKRRF